MRLRYVFVSLFLLITGVANAQSELPASRVNLGIGAGMNYGAIGVKSVIGYKNSGLLIGLGVVPGGVVGYEIGGQYSYRWFFVNLGYGVSGTIQKGDNPPEPVKSGCLMLGGMINLDKNKRVFLELGIGHTFATEKNYVFGHNITKNGIAAVIGLGYRIGNVD